MKHMRITEASLIFRAMKGEKWAQEYVSLDKVIGLEPAETFTEFLRVNQIRGYEEVVREGGKA